MMAGVVEKFGSEVIIVDRLYDLDRDLFGIDEMPEKKIKTHAQEAARKIAVQLGM